MSGVSIRNSTFGGGGLGVFVARPFRAGDVVTSLPPLSNNDHPDYTFHGFGGNRISTPSEDAEQCGHMANDGGYYHWVSLVDSLMEVDNGELVARAVVRTWKEYDDESDTDNNCTLSGSGGDVIATEDLDADTEISLSYGYRYWLSRLPLLALARQDLQPRIKLLLTYYCSRLLGGGWYADWPRGFYMEDDGQLWSSDSLPDGRSHVRAASDADCRAYGFSSLEEVKEVYEQVEDTPVKPSDYQLMLTYILN